MEHAASGTGGRSQRRRLWRRGLSALLTLTMLLDALAPCLLAQAPAGTPLGQPYTGTPLNLAPTAPPTGYPVQPGVPVTVMQAPSTIPPASAKQGTGQPPAFGQPGASWQPPAIGQPAAPPPGMDPATRAWIEKLVSDRLKEEKDKEKQKLDADKAQGAVVGSMLGANATWRNGFWIETPNKDFTFHLGGAVQYDLSTYTNSQDLVLGPHSTGPFQDGVNLRRGRLRAEGSVYENITYRFELEFFNGVTPPGAAPGVGRAPQLQTFATPGPTDAWFTITKLPVIGNIRFGNQKEPISLEHLESFMYLPFLERSPLFDFNTPTAFNNGFAPGILLFNSVFNDRATWALGGFKNSYDVYGFGLGDGEYAVTGRLTWLPWYQDDGQYLMHLGISGSHRDPIGQQDRFRVRTSDRNAPAPLTPFVNVLIDTGFFNTTSQDIMNLEFFTNLGPLTIQAEFLATWLQNTALSSTSPNMGTTYFYGSYVQAMYWLTGEYTRWDKKAATPTAYVPNRPFYLMNGIHGLMAQPGAWQLAARYSYVDENNKGINGGTLSDLTLGLNWILNQNTKIQWNYDYEYRGGFTAASNGYIHAFGMRMQFNF